MTRTARRERATKIAREVYEAGGFRNDPDVGHFWEHDEPGWEPEGGWQGDALAEEISYMTHEEKIEWLEWLAEELDTTVSELFEMMGSP